MRHRIQRVEIELEGSPRQYVEATQRRHFARACPRHGALLLSDDIADTLRCPAGHRVRRWVIVETTARVVTAVVHGRVIWNQEGEGTYQPTMRIAGRNAAGCAPRLGRPMNALPGWKQEAHRLRNAGWEPWEARAEAKRRCLARLADAAADLAATA